MTTAGMGLWFSLNGDEIYNAARSSAYLDNGVRPSRMDLLGCCEPCPGLVQVLGDDPYVLPDVDATTPWFDPAFRESADFAGLMVEDITFSTPVAARPFTQNVGDGGTLGRLRLAGRTLTVTGWLAGRTCCAVAYGLRWLQAALMPACVDDLSCGGQDACFLTCCPSTEGPTGVLTACDTEGNPITYTGRDSEQTEFQRGGDFWRRMYNVGLVDGVNVTERVGLRGDCGCTEVMRVEFTLAIGTPWLFADPVACLDNAQPAPCIPGGCRTPDEMPACPEFTPCLDDPTCPPPAKPPGVPTPVNPCVCIPLNTRRVTCHIPAPAGGDWFDATTIVRVVATSDPLRNLAIRMWANPLGLADDELDDCLACSTAFITYVPAGGELILDGRTRRNTITCGTTVRDASPNIFQLSGLPFTGLELGCDPAVVAVDFACGSPLDARVSIEVVKRALW